MTGCLWYVCTLRVCAPSLLFTLLQLHAGLPYKGAGCWTKAIQAIFLQHKSVSIFNERSQRVVCELSMERDHALKTYISAQYPKIQALSGATNAKKNPYWQGQIYQYLHLVVVKCSRMYLIQRHEKIIICVSSQLTGSVLLFINMLWFMAVTM